MEPSRIKHTLTGVVGCILMAGIFLAGCAPMDAAPVRTGTIALESCTLTAPGLTFSQNARCGTLTVFEKPETQSGKTLDLKIAVIPAQSSSPLPDPLFLLAGGPGEAATRAFVPFVKALDRVNFKRDLVLVDQRGTGENSPFQCPAAEEASKKIDTQDTAALAQNLTQCYHEAGVNPQQYATRIAVQDLDAVRAGLGYDQINLLGVSYGTRVALTYLRQYPGQVRTLTLDGVVPDGWTLGSSADADSQRALDLTFERCLADSACGQTFPDLTAEFNQLLTTLEEKPAAVTVPDPLTGEDTAVELTRDSAAGTIRLINYNSEYTALLPWMIHRAAQGDYRPLAAQQLIVNGELSGALDFGMYYSVICQEDVPFLPQGTAESAGYLQYDFDLPRQLCAGLALTPQPAEQRTPFAADVPTLILSGEADPVTPPANGDQAAANLSNSKHLVIPQLGHGNMTRGCVPSILRDFLEAGSVENLDTACIEQIKAQPFFISPMGPQP